MHSIFMTSQEAQAFGYGVWKPLVWPLFIYNPPPILYKKLCKRRKETPQSETISMRHRDKLTTLHKRERLISRSHIAANEVSLWLITVMIDT
jgi:hypothetical protein